MSMVSPVVFLHARRRAGSKKAAIDFLKEISIKKVFGLVKASVEKTGRKGNKEGVKETKTELCKMLNTLSRRMRICAARPGKKEY